MSTVLASLTCVLNVSGSLLTCRLPHKLCSHEHETYTDKRPSAPHGHCLYLRCMVHLDPIYQFISAGKQSRHQCCHQRGCCKMVGGGPHCKHICKHPLKDTLRQRG